MTRFALPLILLLGSLWPARDARAGWQRDMVCQGSCGGACGPCSSSRDSDAADRAAERAAARARAARRERGRRFDELVASVKEAVESGDYDKALELAGQAQGLFDDEDTRRWIAWLRGAKAFDQGRRALDAKDYDSALSYFRSARSLGTITDESLAEAERNISAGVYQKQKEDEERALHDAYVQQTADDKKDAAALLDEARADLDKGDFEAARDKALRAMRLDGSNPKCAFAYHLANADISERDGDLTETIDSLEKALRADPSNADVRRALTLARQKRTAIQAAMARAESSALARLKPSEVLVEASADVVDARAVDYARVLRQVAEIEDSPARAEARAAFIALAERRREDALKWYRAALEKDPGNKALAAMVRLAEWNLEPYADPASPRRLPPAADKRTAAAVRGAGAELELFGNLELMTPSADDLAVDRVMDQSLHQRPPLSPEAAEDEKVFRKAYFDDLYRRHPELDDHYTTPYIREVAEEMAQLTAERSLQELARGDLQTARLSMAQASDMAPWKPDYEDALQAMNDHARGALPPARRVSAPGPKPDLPHEKLPDLGN